MLIYTVAKANNEHSDKLVIIGIQINIYESDYNINGIRFNVINCSSDVGNSLMRATVIMRNRNQKLFDNKNIIVSITSSSLYTSPYLTSLILYCYMCWKYKIYPLEKYVIFGDVNNDGKSTNETFDIVDTFNKYFPDKKLLYNMSYDEIEAKVAAQKIELCYLKYKYVIDNDDTDDNYYIEI